MMNPKDRSINPSHEGLIINIIKFSLLLRENGVPVSFSSVMDAIRSLRFINISDLDLFRSLLRMNFIFRKDDIHLFDTLFYDFWLMKAQTDSPSKGEGGDDPKSKNDDPYAFENKAPDDKHREDKLTAELQDWIACYSPDPMHRTTELGDFTESRALYESIKKWLMPLRNHLSRRFRYTIRGKKINLRRVLRKNMQFGGELILLDFKKKKIKNKRIIFFCDVSGSMDVFTMLLLHFIHALKCLDHRTEIFFFSTDLSRWTGRVDTGDYIDAISRLPESVSDWGGGTRIGHSLRKFNEIYGRWMLSGRTIVMIFSDGWDRGDTDILASQMAYLHSKAHRVIWLNPLIGTKDYQPICQGMSTALPYVDYFLPMGNLKDMRYLSKTLSKIVA